MAPLTLITALVACASFSEAHFAFIRLAHNGVWQAPTQYIRNKTSPFEEPFTPNTNVNTRHYIDPTFASDLPESVRCGRDNMAHAAGTEVLKAKPGDTIEVAHLAAEPDRWTESMFDCPDGRGACLDPGAGGMTPNRTVKIIHPGPFLAHLSKVPDGQDVRAYDGSGEWLKIYTLGLESNAPVDRPCHWLASNDSGVPGRFIFQLPEQTPAGQYLLRFDMIWPGLKTADYLGNAQIYGSCAQIEVDSETTGPIPTGIRIPEDICDHCTGMGTSLEMYRQQVIDSDFVYPGGPLWDGQTVVQDRPIL